MKIYLVVLTIFTIFTNNVNSKINKPKEEYKLSDLSTSRNLKKKNILLDDVYQIKMYWERGMAWQETYSEWAWCAECEDDDCKPGGYVVIKTCNINKPDQLWLFEDSKIKSYTNPKVCLTTDKDDPEGTMQLMSCNNRRDAIQEYYLLHSNNIFNSEDKFQIKTNYKDRDDLCVSTNHHPSRGEKLKFVNCIRAEKNDPGVYDDTSRWVLGRFDVRYT